MSFVPFRVDLLGRFRLTIDGKPLLEPISTRGQELLALLVLEARDGIPRERVASRLWPESGEAQARTNLRRELHQLRRVLPATEAAIETNGALLALRLGSLVHSDLDELRALLDRADSATGAAELPALAAVGKAYLGEILPECFSDWLASERERLRDRVVDALHRLTVLLEERRDLVEALVWARRIGEIDPVDEIAYRAQMRLHAAASDRAAALHAYHRCANVLERELGIEPSPETRELYSSLLEAASGQTSSPQAPVTRGLHGRKTELDRLLAAWRSREPERPRLACILGEPGIGKSRLADEVARIAEREGASVARARAYAAEGQLSYAPVVDWLRSPANLPRLNDLDPVWRAEIARLLLDSPANEAEAKQTGGDESFRRRRLFEAVARTLLTGSRPVLLLLDDLHWCDPETLALIHYISRFESSTHVLVIVTARSAELGDNEAAQRLLLALRQEDALIEIELGPLQGSELVELVRSTAGDSDAIEIAERLFRLSEGNPLFALEALRAGLHRAPSAPAGNLLERSPRVRGVLTARLAQLNREARELARCAATIGRAFSFDVLREAADLDERELVVALDELWRRRIVREHATLGYDFSHDVLREAAKADSSPARARLLHRRVAQALELVHAASLDELAASLAVHYELAGLPERAIGYYRRAARAAANVYANQRAVALIARALELVAERPPSRKRDQDELWLLLEQAPSLRAAHGYSDRRVLGVLERARELAEGLEDAPACFQVFRNLWASRFVLGDLLGTLDLAERMRELAKLLPDVEAETDHALAGPLTHLGELAKAIEHFESARRRYDPRDAHRQLSVFGSDLGVFNCAWEAHALWLYGLEDRAVASADEAVRTARTLEHAYSEALAQAYASVLHYMRRDRKACAEAAGAARDLCRRHEFAYYGHWGTLLGAWAGAEADPPAATTAIREALEALDREGATARRPIYLAAYAEVLMAAGERAAALAALDKAEALATTSGDRIWCAEIDRLRALFDRDHAVSHAEKALERAIGMRARPLAVRSAVTLAHALGSAGNARAARVVRETLAALPDGGSSLDREQALQLLLTLN